MSHDDDDRECDECGHLLSDLDESCPACGGRFCGECCGEHECENEEYEQ